MGNPFNQWGNLSKKEHLGGIVGEWGMNKSHGGGQKIRGGVLSWGVLLRCVMSC